MPRYLALLRAVNVGGRNLFSMAELKAFLEALGYTDVHTILQSGNVIFTADETDAVKVERMLEAESAKRFGTNVEYIVRFGVYLEKVLKANPYPETAKEDPSRFVVAFLKGAPTEQAVEDLKAAIKGREELQAVGRELYIIYPDGQGNSKLTNQVIEKKLGLRGTARNWNTVLKIAAKLDLERAK